MSVSPRWGTAKDLRMRMGERAGRSCSSITVIIRIPTAMQTQPDQKQLREGRVCFSPELSGHAPSLRQVRVGTRSKNWSREREGPLPACSPLLSPYCLLPIDCSTHFLIQPRTPAQTWLPPTVSEALSNQSLIKTPLHRTVHRPLLWRHLYNLGSPSKRGLCRVDKNQAVQQPNV